MAVALDGNNPGGLNNGSFAASQPGYTGSNGRYAAFDNLADGLNAQYNLLQLYLSQGVNTPNEIAAKYAPAKDGNNQVAYAQNLANALGIGVNDTITSAQLPQMMKYQDQLENGAVTSNPAFSQWLQAHGVTGSAPSNGASTTSASGSSSSTGTSVLGSIANYLGLTKFQEDIVNMFVRGGVFILAIVIIGFGLYYLADPDGTKTTAAVKSLAETA